MPLAHAAHSQSNFFLELIPKTVAPFALGCANAISLAVTTACLEKEAIATEELSIILLITISTAFSSSGALSFATFAIR